MIDVQSLSVEFDDKPVLHDVSLRVPAGTSLAVIGRSGSGKSVLMKTLLGLVSPTSGTIRLDGDVVTPAVRQRFFASFGMLFQGAALFDGMPIWENVAFRLLQGGMPRKTAKQAAIAKLEIVGLDENVADLYPAALSGGMQKRAGLARAIAADPRVLFIDEPTTGLDPVMASTINELIAKIVADSGVTALTITHDMSSADRFADHLAFLDQGRIAWHGAQSDLADANFAPLQNFIAGRASVG